MIGMIYLLKMVNVSIVFVCFCHHQRLRTHRHRATTWWAPASSADEPRSWRAAPGEPLPCPGVDVIRLHLKVEGMLLCIYTLLLSVLLLYLLSTYIYICTYRYFNRCMSIYIYIYIYGIEVQLPISQVLGQPPAVLEPSWPRPTGSCGMAPMGAKWDMDRYYVSK